MYVRDHLGRLTCNITLASYHTKTTSKTKCDSSLYNSISIQACTVALQYSFSLDRIEGYKQS